MVKLSVLRTNLEGNLKQLETNKSNFEKALIYQINQKMEQKFGGNDGVEQDAIQRTNKTLQSQGKSTEWQDGKTPTLNGEPIK